MIGFTSRSSHGLPQQIEALAEAVELAPTAGMLSALARSKSGLCLMAPSSSEYCVWR